MRRLHLWVIGVAVAAGGCGGGDGLVPVTGAVASAGKPVAGATVMFIPDGTPDPTAVAPTATTEDDGRFTLFTGDRPGAKPGKYIVTVVWPDPKKAPTDAQRMMGASKSDAPDLLAGRYATRDKSTLRATVAAGPTALDPFEVK